MTKTYTMVTNLKIKVKDEHLIDIINFLDQKNISIDFDREKLFATLIDGKKYDEIDFFLDRGTPETEFIKLCSDEDDDVINFILERNQDLCDNNGEYLVKLISTSNIESAKKLISSSEDNIKELVNYDNGKPLILAAEKGDRVLIKLLFLSGAKIKYCLEDPLINLIKNNHTDLIKLFIDNGSNINNIRPEHFSYCIINKLQKSVEYITTLLSNDFLPHFAAEDLFSCLSAAVNTNNADLLYILVDIAGGINEETRRELISYAKGSLIVKYLMSMQTNREKDKKKRNKSDLLKISRGGVSFKD